MRQIRVLCCLYLLVLASACGDDDTGMEPIIPADAGDGPARVVIGMAGNQFSPMLVTVRVGDTIVWMNDDDELHTVTSGQGSTSADVGSLFDENVQPGGSFSWTFDTPGEQPYFCRIHEAEGMRGTITVTQ